MSKASLVHVVDAKRNLSKYATKGGFREQETILLIYNSLHAILQQIATFGVLCHDIDSVADFKFLHEVDDELALTTQKRGAGLIYLVFLVKLMIDLAWDGFDCDLHPSVLVQRDGDRVTAFMIRFAHGLILVELRPVTLLLQNHGKS